jgi:putative transposase
LGTKRFNGKGEERMPGSYFELYIHLVWAVKNREPWLTSDIEKSITDIIKMKAESQKARVIAIGNTIDHIHVLVSIHPDTTISVMMKEMKAAASYYVNHNLGKVFYWQDGYAALSVSKKGLEKVRDYVENQKMHHAQKYIVELFETFHDAGLNR